VESKTKGRVGGHVLDVSKKLLLVELDYGVYLLVVDVVCPIVNSTRVTLQILHTGISRS